MKTVERMLQTKGREVWSTTPTSSVYDALAMLAEKNIGALLVQDGEKVVGIFSERDYARKVVLHGKVSRDTPVSQVMTDKVFCIDIHQSIDECMAVMTRKHFRHLPVLDGEKLVGIVSIGDVVKETISDQMDTINHLENYITGRR